MSVHIVNQLLETCKSIAERISMRHLSPSKIDLLYAWPWYVYLILSVCGKSCTASAWRLQENRRGFYRECLVPEKIADLSQHRERDRFL